MESPLKIGIILVVLVLFGLFISTHVQHHRVVSNEHELSMIAAESGINQGLIEQFELQPSPGLSKGCWITNDSDFKAGVSGSGTGTSGVGSYDFKARGQAASNQRYCSSETNIQLNGFCQGNNDPENLPYTYGHNQFCDFIKDNKQQIKDSENNLAYKTFGHVIQNDRKTCGQCYQIQAINPSNDYPKGGAIVMAIDGAAIKQPGGGSVEMGDTDKETVFPGSSTNRIPVKYRMVDCKTFEPICKK